MRLFFERFRYAEELASFVNYHDIYYTSIIAITCSSNSDVYTIFYMAPAKLSSAEWREHYTKMKS